MGVGFIFAATRGLTDLRINSSGITGAAVPPVPAPRQGEVLHESKFLREISNMTKKSSKDLLQINVLCFFLRIFWGTRAETFSGVTWKRLSEKDISACLTGHFPWGF